MRIYGTPLESLVGAWATAFRDKQGHVRLNAYLINTSQAFAGLVTGKADIGLMGHRTWHTSLMAFHKVFGYDAARDPVRDRLVRRSRRARRRA